MPGVNQTGKSQPQDYTLGRGKVFFASDAEILQFGQFGTLDDDESGPYRDLGNATEFNVTVETESLEHQSSLSGLKTVDKEVKLSQKVSLSISLDEINFENLGIFLSGEDKVLDTDTPNALYTNRVTGGTNTDTICTLLAPAKARWYEMRETAASAGAFFVFDIDAAQVYGGGSDDQVLVEYDNAGGSTFVTATLTTDYEIDKVMGRIFFPATSTIGLGANVKVTIEASQHTPAAYYQTVKALTEGEIAGKLMFIAENPANDDHRTTYLFHQVNLKAEGDFSLVGDEFTTMQLTGAAEAGSGASDTDPKIFTVRTHLGASQPST